MIHGELRLRATVLAHFEVPWLGLSEQDEAAAADLLFEDCERVAVGDGERHWALDDSVRRAVAADSSVGELRAARERVRSAPDVPRQWAIDRLLSDDPLPPLESFTVAQRRALDSVTRWLGSAKGVPSHRVIHNRVAFEDLLAPLRAVSENFVGREQVLADLAGPLRSGGRPRHVQGLGGVGKSALCARHLLRAVEAGTAIAYLNFDHPALEPERPTSLLRAMAAQLATQLDGEAASAAERLVAAISDRRRTAGRELEVQTRSIQMVVEDVEDGLAQLARLLADRPCLIVMDTLEVVQRRPRAAIESLRDFIQAVLHQIPRTQIVLAGRAPEPALDAKEIELSGLEPPEAVALVRGLLDGYSDADVEQLIELVPTTHPLVLRLAASLFRLTDTTGPLRDLEVHRTALEGLLYSRLLGHIPDQEVRRLAIPSLAVRRITPDVIRHVLGRPSGVDIPDDEKATDLFSKLTREAMLVERHPHDPDAVVHRADVRQMALLLLRDQASAQMARVHRAAVRYYDARDDVASRTEAMYHRLMLGRRERTLNRYWDKKLLGGLQDSIDDLPPRSKAYLASKSTSLGVSTEDLREADAETRRQLLQRRIIALAADGRLAEAMELMDLSKDRSPAMADLRVQMLELTGQLDKALRLAESQRKRAARSGSTAEFFSFNFHVSRLAERAGAGARARRSLEEGLEAARGLDAAEDRELMELRHVVALLGIDRRAGSPPDRALVDEALLLTDSLPMRRIRSTPGLLRDLAAEIGLESPKLLRAALLAVGISLATGKRGDEEVARVVADAAAESATEAIGDALAWAQNEERAALGRHVSQSLGNPELFDHLAHAVSELFAREADDASTYTSYPEPPPEA